MISIDITLLYQIIAYFLLLGILNKLLFKPVMATLEEREASTTGKLEEAESIDSELNASIDSYEASLKAAALEGTEARGKLRAEASTREKEILEAARSEAAKELSNLRGDIDKSREAALDTLKSESGDIAKSIAEKVLSRKLASFIVLLLPVLTLLIPDLALAAGGGGDHEGGDSSAMAWKVFNFLLLAVGIYFLWTKVLSKALHERAEGIRKALEEAKEAKDAAEARAAEYKDKLDGLEAKIEEIKSSMVAEGKAEKNRIIAEAEAAGSRLKDQVRQTAEQEAKKAREVVASEVSLLAVKLAEELLKGEAGDEDQKRLTDEYIDKMRVG